ncbi:MAG: hypothetical protein QE269_02230 [Fimbriimonas sp.]|nr:hypothetical protein [Fimbriimonas sp.]
MISSALLALTVWLPQEPKVALPVPEQGYARPKNRIAGDKAMRIVFVRTSFANDSDPMVSRHSEAEMTEVGEALTSFFKIQSYGSMTVSKFEVSPVLRLGKSELYERTDKDGKELPAKQRRNAISDAVAAAQRQLGRDLKQEFDMICVMLNASPTGGKIAPPGVAALATGPQTSIFFGAKHQWRVYAHEIGHNMGFPHAWSVLDKNGAQTLSSDRNFIEYGDPTTPMGKGSNSYSLIEKYRMGWIGNSESDTRFIKRFDPGEMSFLAYDRPDAKGCVGGYINGEFGVEIKELVSKRDGADNGGDVPSTETPGPQRLWFSVISRGNLTKGDMADLPRPLLLAHLSSLVPPAKGAGKAFTTVSLDLKPAPARNRREQMAGKGLLPGQSGTIKMKDGKVVVVKFVAYDSQTHLAKVSAVLQ